MSTDPFDLAVLLVIVAVPLALAVFGGGLEEKRSRHEELRQSGRRP